MRERKREREEENKEKRGEEKNRRGGRRGEVSVKGTRNGGEAGEEERGEGATG